MTQAKVTFEDKSSLNPEPDSIRKLSDNNVNELKAIINNNADDTTEKIFPSSGSLLRVKNKMIMAGAGNIEEICCMYTGDSFGGRISGWIAKFLEEAHADNKGYCLGNTGDLMSGSGTTGGTINYPGGPVKSRAGDVTEHNRIIGNHDYTVWPTGAYESVGVGGELTFTVGGGTVFCDSIFVYYYNEPGGGTFDVEYSNSTSGPWTLLETIDTNNAISGGVSQKTDLDPAQKWTFRVVGKTGVCKIIGGGFKDSSKVTVTGANLATGGLNIDHMVQTPQSVLTPILQSVNPSLVFFEAADEVEKIEPNFATWIGNIRAACPACDFLVIAPPPRQSDDDFARLVTDWYRDNAKVYNFAFFDTYKEAISWDWIDTTENGGDGLHLPAQFNAGVAFKIITNYGLYMPMLQNSIEKITI